MIERKEDHIRKKNRKVDVLSRVVVISFEKMLKKEMKNEVVRQVIGGRKQVLTAAT